MVISRAQLPNLLTYARVLAVPVSLLLIVCYPDCKAALFWIFLFAALTDFLDGYLARRWNAVTPLGTLLDPVADKLLVALMLLYLLASGTIPAFTTTLYAEPPFAFTAGNLFFPIAVILLRELYVSGLREFLAHRRIALPVSKGGKWKTACQMLAIALLLSEPAFHYAQAATFGARLLWVAAALALESAWHYTRASLPHLKAR